MSGLFVQALGLLSYLFFHWKGALTESSITFKIFVNPRLASSVTQWSLVYYVDNSSVIFSQTLPIATTLDPIELSLTGLQPLTLYKYCFFFGALPSDITTTQLTEQYEIFQFKTFQVKFLKQNITIPFSSCAKTGSEDEVFLDIVELFHDAQLFIQMGDIYYGDITSEHSTVLFQESYFRIFESKTQKKFYQHFPTLYIWDDHDFGDNNSGSSSLAKESATEMYLQIVPHYPFRAFPHKTNTAVATGIYQYTIIGQTLVVIMDLRTAFIQGVQGMDEAQQTWLFEILSYAETENLIENVIIVSSIPWQGDDWVSFKQRIPIGEKIQKLLKIKQNVLLISGDSHMIAFDNGYNNNAGGFPNTIASPMDKTPSCKGGKYTFGPFEGNGQYQTLEILYFPHNLTNCFLVKGWRKKEMLFSYNSCNENHRNLKTSHSCLTTQANAVLISIAVIAAAMALVGIIWYKGRSLAKEMGQKSYSYGILPKQQEMVNEVGQTNQNLDYVSQVSPRNITPIVYQDVILEKETGNNNNQNVITTNNNNNLKVDIDRTSRFLNQSGSVSKNNQENSADLLKDQKE